MTDEEQLALAMRVLGRRFVADFTVEAIGPGPLAVLMVRGQPYALSLEELQTLIDADGLFVEAPFEKGHTT